MQEFHASLTPEWESSGQAPHLSAWIVLLKAHLSAKRRALGAFSL